MKKLLPVLAVVLLVFGCNKEKIYKDNLQGTWNVYKYLLNNVDHSTKFAADNPDYRIEFTSAGAFTETSKPLPPDSVVVIGTYSFTDNDQKIVLENDYLTTTYLYDSSNTNIIDSTITTHAVKRTYTIFNLTKDHVQLRTDSSQLYMRKPATP